MATERKDAFFGKYPFPKKAKERLIMSNNNNQLNIPQAKEAMNKFKMQAASDEDVLSTS